MNRNSIERLSIIIWLTALLFLSVIPVNKNDRSQDDQSEVSAVSAFIQQNNSEPYFDVEETEDASKHHFKEIHWFPDSHFREMAVVKNFRKCFSNNKNQIDITFFNLPPPVQLC